MPDQTFQPPRYPGVARPYSPEFMQTPPRYPYPRPYQPWSFLEREQNPLNWFRGDVLGDVMFKSHVAQSLGVTGRDSRDFEQILAELIPKMGGPVVAPSVYKQAYLIAQAYERGSREQSLPQVEGSRHIRRRT